MGHIQRLSQEYIQGYMQVYAETYAEVYSKYMDTCKDIFKKGRLLVSLYRIYS